MPPTTGFATHTVERFDGNSDISRYGDGNSGKKSPISITDQAIFAACANPKRVDFKHPRTDVPANAAIPSRRRKVGGNTRTPPPSSSSSSSFMGMTVNAQRSNYPSPGKQERNPSGSTREAPIASIFDDPSFIGPASLRPSSSHVSQPTNASYAPHAEHAEPARRSSSSYEEPPRYSSQPSHDSSYPEATRDSGIARDERRDGERAAENPSSQDYPRYDSHYESERRALLFKARRCEEKGIPLGDLTGASNDDIRFFLEAAEKEFMWRGQSAKMKTMITVPANFLSWGVHMVTRGAVNLEGDPEKHNGLSENWAKMVNDDPYSVMMLSRKFMGSKSSGGAAPDPIKSLAFGFGTTLLMSALQNSNYPGIAMFATQIDSWIKGFKNFTSPEPKHQPSQSNPFASAFPTEPAPFMPSPLPPPKIEELGREPPSPAPFSQVPGYGSDVTAPSGTKRVFQRLGG